VNEATTIARVLGSALTRLTPARRKVEEGAVVKRCEEV